MREHLLGYLIGALDPSEAEQVERLLEEDPQLEHDLNLVRANLEPLALDSGHCDPPDGLARRTCQFVASRRVGLCTDESCGRAARWGFQDMLIAAGILTAASMLFFPALNQSRFLAQRRVCQDNLQRIGTALVQYSMVHKNYFPYIPDHGHLASTGLYAPALFHSGFLTDKQRFLCPSCGKLQNSDFTIPTYRELIAASSEKLQRLRHMMGGSYCFTFGYLSGGRYVGTKNLGRQQFALLSDSPCTMKADFDHNSANHRSRGQNVLFEDGHVDFLTSTRCNRENGCDDIFANENGVLGPGLNRDDSVIAPAWIEPVVGAAAE